MKRYLFMLIALLFTHVSMMGQKSDIQIRKEISQAASAVKSMQCDFVQTKHIKMLNNNMVSKGKMYYQQSSCLRWEYTSPYTYTFILNNNKVLLKNSKRNDVIDVNQNKMFKEIANIMMNSVVGNCLSNNNDFRSSIATVGGEWVATLQPLRKEMKQMFQKIVLHFNRSQAIVSQVELIEENGDKTIIVLKNVKTNEKINTNMFSIR